MRLALLLLVLVACTKDNDIRLTFGEGQRVPLGFRCREAVEPMRLLVQRAVTNRTLRFSVVTDFIGLEGGFPTCRLSQIVDFCTDHVCGPITDPPTRVCTEFEQALGPTDDALTALFQILTHLPDAPLVTDAPDVPMIIRVVVTAQPCNQLPGLDVNQLVGCVFSCPLQPDQISGDVLLDLPVFNDNCEAAVLACAGQTLRGN